MNSRHIPGGTNKHNSCLVRRFYEECSDLRRVVRQLNFYQDEYNISGNGAEMSLVFFPDAVRHLLRISRILRQPRGNAILIGLAGADATIFQAIGHVCEGCYREGKSVPALFPPKNMHHRMCTLHTSNVGTWGHDAPRAVPLEPRHRGCSKTYEHATPASCHYPAPVRQVPTVVPLLSPSYIFRAL